MIHTPNNASVFHLDTESARTRFIYESAIAHHIGQWFHAVDKTVMRVAVGANQQQQLLANLQADVWQQTQSWVRLVKGL